MTAVQRLTGFAIGFILTVALSWVLPYPPGTIEERVKVAFAERERCDVLFVGPSYVWNNFEPSVFDAEARRIGLEHRSCKFGASTLMGYELRLALEHLLAQDWPRLEVVVIDVTLGASIAFPEKNWFKPRTVEWHTWSAVPWLAGYYTRRDSGSWLQQAPVLWAHLKHMGAHYARLGVGREVLERVQLFDADFESEQPPRAQSEVVPESAAKRLPTRTQLARAIKKIKARKKRQGDSHWPLELRDLVRAHGKEAYFLFAPVLYGNSPPKRARQGEDRLVLLDFNDPIRFPELYQMKVRGHTHHLNEKGTRLYSALLAREIQTIESTRR